MDALSSIFGIIRLVRATANTIYPSKYMFTAGDLQEATEIAIRTEHALGIIQTGESAISLNFRALQAQRIQEMQARLVTLSTEKINPTTSQEVSRTLNDEMDDMLDQYGVYAISFAFAWLGC